MTSRLFALCFDAIEPDRAARFWSRLLGWEIAADGTPAPADDRVTPTNGTMAPADGPVTPTNGTPAAADGAGFRLRFTATDRPKIAQNLMHFDLTSTDLADQERTVARALELGGRHIDIGQLPEEKHVVLADPEGNEFCVIEPGNNFLAGCGFVGAVSGDGLAEVGYFWSAALGWPLVWDQDGETAIQSPLGGTKITWGGPPPMPNNGDRVRFELVTDDLGAEIDRLVELGAKRSAPSVEPGAKRSETSVELGAKRPETSVELGAKRPETSVELGAKVSAPSSLLVDPGGNAFHLVER